MAVCNDLVFICGECREPLPCSPDCPGTEIATFRCDRDELHTGQCAVDSRWDRMAAGQDG